MKREADAKVVEEESQPNTVKLTDGSYVLWDRKDGFYRVAYYARTTKKGSDLEMTLALAMKKPVHNSKVKSIFSYIEKTDEYASPSS